MNLINVKETRKESISVGSLYESNKERLKLTSLTGESGFNQPIKDKNLHRPGLALAGYVQLFRYDRVQICGNTEIQYLKDLTLEKREAAIKSIFKFNIPCFIVTNGNVIDDLFIAMAKSRDVAVFSTPFETTKFVYFLSDFLDDQFSPQTVVHGSFVDVYGIGLLLIGPSGIGKSEIALDLVERGHRLVADDVVMITRKGEGILMGAGTDLVKHFMEIRGLGLIDVRSTFGIRAIRFQKRGNCRRVNGLEADSGLYTHRTG
jgi:HPr kinase/phosphorylase